MLFAEASEAVQIVGLIVGGVTGIVTAIGVPWMAVLLARQKTAADKVAAKVEQAAGKAEDVKTALAESNSDVGHKLDGLAKVGEATHTLVNSNMGVQLKLNAVLARRLADITKDGADMEAAALADKLLAEHVAKQAVVDSKAAEPAKGGA